MDWELCWPRRTQSILTTRGFPMQASGFWVGYRRPETKPECSTDWKGRPHRLADHSIVRGSTECSRASSSECFYCTAFTTTKRRSFNRVGRCRICGGRCCGRKSVGSRAVCRRHRSRPPPACELRHSAGAGRGQSCPPACERCFWLLEARCRPMEPLSMNRRFWVARGCGMQRPPLELTSIAR